MARPTLAADGAVVGIAPAANRPVALGARAPREGSQAQRCRSQEPQARSPSTVAMRPHRLPPFASTAALHRTDAAIAARVRSFAPAADPAGLSGHGLPAGEADPNRPRRPARVPR